MLHFEKTNPENGFHPRELNRIKAGMQDNLSCLLAGEMCQEDALSYVASLMEQQEEKGHWSVFLDWNAPAEVRVDYIYHSTYLACAFLMAFTLRNPSVCECIPGFADMLAKGLDAAAGRKFLGSFGDEKIRYETMELFIQAGLREFMLVHQSVCPSFSQLVRNILVETRARLDSELKSREPSGGNAVQNKGLSPEYRGGESMSSLSADLVGKMSEMMTDQSIPGGTLVFVYGTLMTGRANHRHFMTGAVSVGAGELHGYAMYDIGAYPGIKLSRKDSVKGELFLVDEQTLECLDMLEGNGSLYDRVNVEVRSKPADVWLAQTYAYRGPVRGDRKVKKGDQPWGKVEDNMDEKYVWYACYGSNLSHARFMEYINSCADTTEPSESRPFQIPHRLYFGNTSSKWDCMAVAFLDPKVDPTEKTYGRLYRISNAQYMQVKRKEGSNYTHALNLGELEGMPIVSFTSPVVFEPDTPSKRYLDVIRTGLTEIWPELGTAEHERYLRDHVCTLLEETAHEDIEYDVEYMVEIGVLRAIYESPHAISVRDIRNIVTSSDKSFDTALKSLTENQYIRQHRKYRGGVSDPDTRYFTEPEKRVEIEKAMGGGFHLS